MSRQSARTLTITVCRRPVYTARTLRALLRCHGVERYSVAVVFDGQCDETMAVVDELAPAGWVRIFTGVKPLGCNTAIKSALIWGFATSDYHVHLEDDTLPAADCLSWFEWARQFSGDSSLLSVSAYSRDAGDPATCSTRPWFTPWGWATWDDRWAEIEPRWPDRWPSWDTVMNWQVRGDRRELHPHLARVQNIGCFGGAHTPPTVWAMNHYNRNYAGPDAAVSQWSLA